MTALRVRRSSPIPRTRADRRPPAPLAALLAALALGVASCAGDGEEQGRSSGSAPTEGTVVLFQPPARGSRSGQRLQASTIRITTQADEKSARDEPPRMDDNPEKGEVIVRGGRIVGDGDVSGDGRPTSKGTAREIIRQFQSSAFVVSPETFGTLWMEFEKAGVFGLPRFRGGIPPRDKPTLTITAQGKTWIFIRPTEADPRDLPKDQEKLRKMVESWSRAKGLVTAVLIGG